MADALNLNAGVALAAAGLAPGAAEGVAMAQQAQRSGAGAATLREWIRVSQEAAAAAEQATPGSPPAVPAASAKA